MPYELTTLAGEKLTGTPWNVYPRPQLRRESFVNLNGNWDFAVSDQAAVPSKFDRSILVPFCPESQLSGIGEHFAEGSYLFYRRRFANPGGQRVLLHIGAADQELTCYLNGEEIGSHQGGYEAMTFDLTAALREENELILRCKDDLRDQSYPYGKQVMKRGGMWYTPVSGIWQTVWLEAVPQSYVEELDLQVTLTEATITVKPALSGRILCDGVSYPLEQGKAVITPKEPKAWTPENPYLYDFTVEAGEDRFDSYFALRTLEIKTLKGLPRLCLNGKPYYFHGLLDQGYWPDGLFTPATPECYAEDINQAKALGFNMLRKHIKVEAEEFYYQCDKLGMIVFQDMVNNGRYSFLRDTVLPTIGLKKRSDIRLHKSRNSRQAFFDGMEETVNRLKNFPCIVYWTIFNEGWGQFDSDCMYELAKQCDNPRVYDSTSGWFHQTKNDFDSRHVYYGDLQPQPEKRPLFLSEFGGCAYAVPEHYYAKYASYGYGDCQNSDEVTVKVRAAYDRTILPVIEKGACGSIYTQLSDVEEEINGFYTYDRKVCKVNKEEMLRLRKEMDTIMERIISKN